MTLLTICNAAEAAIGFSRTSAVAASSTDGGRQLLALANEGGKSMARARPWTILQREHTFSTAAGTAEYDLPSDFHRFLNETQWNRTKHWQVVGPVVPSGWQVLKSSSIAVSNIFTRFRVKRAASGNTRKFVIHPTPSAVETIAFEYVSSNWCASSGGTAQSAWAADSDVGILDEYLLTLDLKWRLLKAKGMDYSTDYEEWRQQFMAASSADAGMRTISLAEPEEYVPTIMVPDSGWNL